MHVVPAPEEAGAGQGAPGARWAIRRYQRGGAVASALGDRYLRIGTPRPFRELRISRALETIGIPTPPVVGAAVYSSGIFYRGDLVTEYIPDSRDLAAVLFGASQLPEGGEGETGGEQDTGAGGGAAALEVAGRLVRRLHEAGVVHRDLNLKNILITGSSGAPEAWILDLDAARLRIRVSERARRRMLKRFWRSARKWEERTGTSLPAGSREAFERGYEAAAPLPEQPG